MIVKKKIFRKSVLLASVVLILLIGIHFLLKNNIFADSDSNSVSIPPGWSVINGQDLNSITQREVLDSGVLIYTYNDPNTNNTGWTYLSNNCQGYAVVQEMPCISDIGLNPKLSYLTYNKNSGRTFPKINKTTLSNIQSNYRPGWHIVSPSKPETKQDFLKKTSFKLSSGNIFSADALIDQKAISSNIYSAVSENKSIVFKKITIANEYNAQRLTSASNVWVYFFTPNVKITEISDASESYLNRKYLIGFNPSPVLNTDTQGTNFTSDISELQVNFLRYINFDEKRSERNNDLAAAQNFKRDGRILMGNFLPRITIQTDRGSDILDSSGQKYTHYDKVRQDIRLYSGYSPNGNINTRPANADWNKLEALVREHYFKGMVLPRLNLYKDSIKYWQIWNEPDGNFNSDSAFGIPAEALSLITTGSYKDTQGNILASLEGEQVIYEGVAYDLSQGLRSVVKKMCSDCRVVSAGFMNPDKTSMNNLSYFEVLKQNSYNNFVDAHEFHINLHPNRFMGYTQYWDRTQKNMEIYDTLCSGRNNCNKPIFATEIGSPSDSKYIDDNNGVATGFSMTFSQNFQSDDLIKRFLTISSLGISGLSWNGYRNSSADTIQERTCPSQTNSEGYYEINNQNSLCHHLLKGIYSIQNNGYQKKLSFDAYRILANNIKYASKIEFIQKPANNHEEVNPLFIIKITDNDGKKKYSAWCEPYWNVKNPTDSDAHNEINKAWRYEDRTCSTDIDLSSVLSGLVTITDKLGNIKEANSKSINITQSPIFIESK